MRIPSRDIPQADLLDDVLACARIVSNGIMQGQTMSYQRIATALRKTERQGRYYRRAAEILGLILSSKNSSRITPLGRRVLSADDEHRRAMLTEIVSGLAIFQTILRALRESGGSLNKDEIEELLESETLLGTKEMRRRRRTTIISWLNSLRLVRESDDIISLRGIRPKL